MVVRVLPEVPEEGGGTGMGAQTLVQDVPVSVLAVVSARSPHTGAARHRAVTVGRRGRHNGTGRQAGRAAVQHRRPGRVRVPGRMDVPHAYPAGARRHAAGRHVLSERRFHTH